MRRFFGRLLADDEPTAPVLLSGLRAAIPLGRENFIPAWSYHLGPHPDAGRMLKGWGAFCSALTQPEPDQVLLLLHAFLLTYEPRYGSWHAALDPGVLLSSDAGKQALLTVPRITADAAWLPRYADVVRQSLQRMTVVLGGQQWHEEQEPVSMLYSLYVLACIPHNLEPLAALRLVEPVLGVLAAATKAMQVLCSSAASAGAPRKEADDWPGYCTLVCGVAVRFCMCFFAPLQCWYRAWDAQAEERHALSLALHFGRGPRKVFLAESPLLTELSTWIMLSIDHAVESQDLARLKLVLLECVGSLGHDLQAAFPPAVRSLHLFDALVPLLSWPSAGVAVDDFFQLQLVLLRCLATCVEGSLDNANRLMQLGFVQGLLDIYLWASEALLSAPVNTEATSPASAVASSAPVLSFSSVDEARLILQPTLHTLPCPVVPELLLHPKLGQLFNAFQVLVFGRHPPTGGGAPPNLPMVGFAFDLFNIDIRQTPNNTRARTALCVADRAHLQLQGHVLYLVLETFRRFPLAALRVFRACNAWNSLMSEFFFPAHAPTTLPPARLALQSVVWELLEHAGTLDRSSNGAEVQCLLRCIADPVRPATPLLVARACDALRNLFMCNATATQDAVDSMTSIGEALSRLRFGDRHELPGVQDALGALFRVLALSFTVPKVRSSVVTELGVAEFLLQLLFDPLARPLALDCLLTSMEDPFTQAMPVEAFVKLFQQYLSLFTRVQKIPSEHPFLLSLLAGIRRTLVRKPLSIKVWRRVAVFSTVVVDLLAPGQHLVALCCNVLETLNCLLAHSGAARKEFRAQVGYDKLARILLYCLEADQANESGARMLHERLLPLLFALMVGACDDKALEAPAPIRNSEVIDLLFMLWPALEPPALRTSMLQRLASLVRGIPANQAVLNDKGLVERLLEMLAHLHDPVHDELVRAIFAATEELLSLSMSPHHLKKLTGLLRAQQHTPAWWWGALLGLLHRVSTRRGDWPRYFFDFEGAQSAIVLPSWSWSRYGLTFSAWVQPNVQVDSAASAGYEPGKTVAAAPLSCFVFQFSVGVALLYNRVDETLVYRSLGEEAVIGPLPAGEWTHVVLTHRNSGLLVGRSEVALFLNGECVVPDVVLPYPAPSSSQVVTGLVGNCVSGRGGFQGRMSAFSLYSDALSAVQVAHLFSLGPSFLGPVERPDVIRPSLLLMAFCSVARDGKTLPDCRLVAGAPPATVRRSVLSVRSFSSSDAFQCIGGVRNALPLALQLSDVKHPPPELFAQIIELWAALLGASERNQHDMVASRGFSILGHVLRALPGQCAAPAVADALTRRLGSVLTVPALVEHHVADVLVEVALWAKGTEAAQCEYWSTLHARYFQVNVAQWRHAFGVQALLDALRGHHWHRDARVALFRCLDVLVAAAIAEHESIALMNFLLSSDDELLVEEALDFVLLSLSADNRLAFLAHVSGGGGLVDVFVALFSRSSAAVRLRALLLFSRIPLDDAADFLERTANVLLRALSVWPLTASVASVLVAMMVDRRGLALEVFLDPALAAIPAPLLVDVPLVRHRALLEMLFALLPRAPLMLRAAVLHDVSSLLLGRAENTDCLLRVNDWQLRLLRVLMETERDRLEHPEAAAAIGANMNELLQASFVRAFRSDPQAWEAVQRTVSLVAVHANELAFTRYAFSVLLGLLQHLVAESRSVLSKQAPAAVAYEYERKRGNCMLPNIARVALLVEDFLYYSLPHDVEQCVAECTSARASGVRSVPHPQRFSRVSAVLASAGNRPRTPSMGVRMAPRLARDAEAAVRDEEAPPPLSPPGSPQHDTDAYHRWKDEPLASATIELLSTFGFHTEAAWPYVVDPTGMRPGGGRRVTLRLACDLIRYSTKRMTLEKTVLFLWKAFGKWSAPRGAAAELILPPEPIYVIGMLLATLRQRHDQKFDDNGPDVGSILMPLLRQLLRIVWPIVCAFRKHNGMVVADELEQEEAKSDLGERNLDARAFLEVLERSQWRGLLDTVQTVVASHLGADTSYWIGIREQTLVSIHGALDVVDRSVAQSASAENEFSERMLECERRRLSVERRRFDAMKAALQAKHDKAAARAAVLLHELERPGGAWAAPDAGKNDRWKRDKFETPSRLRPKFKLNRCFDPHLDKGSVLFKPETTVAEEMSSELKAAVAAATGVARNKQAAQEQSRLQQSDDAQQDGSNDDDDEEEEGEEERGGGGGGGGGGEAVESPPRPAVSFNRRPKAGDALRDSSRRFSLVMQDSVAELTNEWTVMECLCGYIKPLLSIEGTLRLTNVALYFVASGGVAKKKQWPLTVIKEAHLRRYLLRDSALEIFFLQNRTALFNFGSADRDTFFQRLVSLRPPRLEYRERSSPEAIFRSSPVTKLWLNHQVSNMDYLMYLNTIAGRTYNDLGQYPVFPWVLSCYGADSVHLEDPACFRDLKLPVGALNAERLQSFMSRFKSFVDPEIPAFMYGSHYSNAGIVLYYLVRMEPFTTYHLALQGGKFDQADRMFHSVPRTWSNVLTHSSDVKELTPEWYYQPEMFRNENGFQLGYRQNGEPLDNVELPSWCRGDADEFVRVNRAALESDYVSENLHHWIDLVFGYKQRGEAAREAYNVFFHLTYGGAVDMDAISDLHQRRAVEEQVRHFGQVPAQLTRIPHPSRKPRVRRPGGMMGAGLSIGSADPWVVGRPSKFAIHVVSLYTGVGIVALCMAPAEGGRSFLSNSTWTKFVTVDTRRIAACHRWLPEALSSSEQVQDAGVPAGGATGSEASFVVEMDSNPSVRAPAGPVLGAGVQWSCKLVAVVDEARMLVTGGHYDHSVTVSTLAESNAVLQRLVWHKDVVTVVAVDALHDEVLVTGSRDATLAVWMAAESPTGRLRFGDTPSQQLHGHCEEVTCAAVCVALDVVVSGARDGCVLLHELARGRLARVLRPFDERVSVEGVAVSATGKVLAISTLHLALFTVNGRLLCKSEAQERVSSVQITRNGEFVFCAHDTGITVRLLSTLQVIHKLRCSGPVACLALTPDENNVLGAMGDGKVIVVSAVLPARGRGEPADAASLKARASWRSRPQSPAQGRE